MKLTSVRYSLVNSTNMYKMLALCQARFKILQTAYVSVT